MNPLRALTLKSRRLSWLFRLSSPGVRGLRPGICCGIRHGIARAIHYGIHRSIQIGIGVGLLAGPILFSAQAAKPGRAYPGSRGVQSDILPKTTLKPEATPTDLLLQKSGEKIAEALASFSEGLAAEENADFERALEAYRRTLSLDPSNTELAVKVAFTLAQRGEVPQGIDILKDAAKASPKESLPPLCLSQLYGKFLKKQDLAERYALTALNLEPESFAAYLALFEIYTVSNQPKKADAILHRASQSPTQDPQFWLQLAEIYSKLPTNDEEKTTRVIAALDKALASGKENLAVMAKVADAYAVMRKVELAIPLYRKVIEGSKNPRSEETLAMRDKLARCLLADGKRDEAIAVLEAMVKDGPARYETYEMLGELHALNDQLERATLSYQQALLIDASQPEKFLRIADLQLRQKKPEEAVKTLTAARARFPRFPRITYSLALVMREAKQFPQALAMFDQAAQEGQNSSEGLFTSVFYFDYGVAAEQAGKLELAAEMLRKCIQLDPSNAAQAYNYLGYMWADKGEHLEEALELIKNALALIPDEAAFLDSLGWCYFKLGDYENAITYLQKAAEKMQPEEAVIFDHLGDAYAAGGKQAEALENWNKAVALDPKNKELTEKIDKAQKRKAPAPAAVVP